MLAQAASASAGSCSAAPTTSSPGCARRFGVPRARLHLPPRRAGAGQPADSSASAARCAAAPRSPCLRAALPRRGLHRSGRRCRFVYESWKFDELAQGLIQVPIWIPQMSLVLGVLIFVSRCSTSWWWCCAAANPTTGSPKRRASPQGLQRVHLMSAILLAAIIFGLMLVLLAGGVWIAMAMSAVAWFGLQFFTSSAARRQPVPVLLGLERVVDARRAAAVRLDGRDPVPHQALGGDVRRPRALARAGCPGA